jgi:hypothetical protein
MAYYLHNTEDRSISGLRPIETGSGSIGSGITESPCRACRHFGTEPAICREYPDCLLGSLRQPEISTYQSDKPTMGTTGWIKKEAEPKICPQCKKIFRKEDADCSHAAWEKRVYCSKRCQGISVLSKRWEKREPKLLWKLCPVCHKVYIRPKTKGAPAFRKSRTCSRACSNVYVHSNRFKHQRLAHEDLLEMQAIGREYGGMWR